jgi:diaminopimelate epimerase
VHVPGGELYIEIGDDWSLTLSGPIAKVFEGSMKKTAYTDV